ncbi:hypothetical protein V8C40DRAFT_236413 [Trichoderma camerunense]
MQCCVCCLFFPSYWADFIYTTATHWPDSAQREIGWQHRQFRRGFTLFEGPHHVIQHLVVPTPSSRSCLIWGPLTARKRN